jgi:diguanylate cyclase (GGDEF)-like protein/PAS domain S-box-containing protein
MATRLSLPLRASVCLTCLMLSLLFLGVALGLVPDPQPAVLAGRKALSEQLAVQCGYLAEMNKHAALLSSLEGAVRRSSDLLSAGIRAPDGKLRHATARHEEHWARAHPVLSSATHLRVPIAVNGKRWGSLEMSYRQEAAEIPFLRAPILPLATFAGVVGGALFYLYLRLLLGRLSVSQPGTIPRRVRTALNTLAEGVVILDEKEQIVVANKAFGDLVGQTAAQLEGKKVSELGWKQLVKSPDGMPWNRTLDEGVAQVGALLTLDRDDQQKRILSVNASPILGDDGRRRGAMATFDNLTVLQRKNAHLRLLLLQLRKSRTEIRAQNKQLKILATRDPLTGCLNRRAFFQDFETQWSAALTEKVPVACIMVDIDHFKSINDRFGHATGDQVLAQTAKTIRTLVRKRDLVCRYGGEEFCILLPGLGLEEAMQVGERCRAGVAAKPMGGVNVTASLGASAVSLGATQPSEMLDQADKALYIAKRGGRNRVVGWHQVPPEAVAPSQKLAEKGSDWDREKQPEAKVPVAPPVAIPFHAVTALVAALGHRHADTAEHSRRVADLCVAAARGLLSRRECYVLEVAALLHDIGKLGVPDAVLLKPGALNQAEWKVIRTHEHIGEEIIESAFSCPELTAIVVNHHAFYGGTAAEPDLPSGQDIPVGARILAIADAYDAIVSDRVYRKGRPPAVAAAELRRCAGTQFDPELVERFLAVVMDRKPTSGLAIERPVALQIGMQIEKLAAALDSTDTGTLVAMARHLHGMATAHDVAAVASAAQQLEQAAGTGCDSCQIAELTIQLIDACRATYRSYLPSPEDAAAEDCEEEALVG